MTLLSIALGSWHHGLLSRMLAHKTLKTNRFVEQFLIFWLSLTAPVILQVGSPIIASTTRLLIRRDISSPKQGGFWWAHLRWLYQTQPADKKRWAPELTTGMYKIWGWAETPVIVFSICIGLILGFGWMGFFWMGAIRLVYSLHMQCLVNSLTHLNHVEEGDSSMNVWCSGRSN